MLSRSTRALRPFTSPTAALHLVDCDPHTLHLDFDDAEAKIAEVTAGRLPGNLEGSLRVVGILPVHVGGVMLDLDRLRDFATRHQLWVLEDAAHSFPAAWRREEGSPWVRCGEDTATVTCFSFYANKTLTTGEGGMAVTVDAGLAERMRLMSLHGLSKDAWDRYTTDGKWDYQIVAPGFKYNLTDIAAALGLHQLRRAEELRKRRQEIAGALREGLADLAHRGNEEPAGLLELPPNPRNRIHAWHLFPIQVCLDQLNLDRNEVIRELNRLGVGTSVHWRPLHLHPYYRETFGWQPQDLPAASAVFDRNITLPLFPAQRPDEIDHVIQTVRSVLEAARLSRFAGAGGGVDTGPVPTLGEAEADDAGPK